MMTLASRSARKGTLLFALLVSLACAPTACSLTSLDYLEKGSAPDARSLDSASMPTLPQDTEDLYIPPVEGSRGTGQDLGSTGPDGPMVPIQPSADAATHDTPLPDLQVKATDLSAPDSSTPIPAGPDAALLDAAKPDNQLFDVPLTADVQSPDGPTIDRPASDTRLASDVPPPDSLLPDSAARDSGPQKPSVLFVVGPSAVLGTGDSVIQAHLVANGYDVTYVREVNLGDSPTVTATMVLISHSITTNNVNNKFRNVAKPVMVWAPALYTNMGLVDGTVPNTQGTTNQIFGPTTLNMKAGAGALAAGLSGTVTVLKLPDQMNYGVPNAQALSVASLPNQSNQWGIFAYETGTQMYGLLAPARRVGFFLSQNGAVSLNANGWALFDAAVAWLAKSN